jgi:hypothetical protein
LAVTQYWSEVRWLRPRAALVALVVFAGTAEPVSAQVFIDPDSPTAKEYEIPLESVRRGAQPGTDPSAPISQGERSAAPFGEGIDGGSSGGVSQSSGSAPDVSSGAGGTDGTVGRSDGRKQDRETAPRSSTPPVIEAAVSNPGAPPSSTGSTLLYLGVGALVLAVGAGAGVVLRRRRA